MANSVATPRVAPRPQFSLWSLLSCIAVVAVGMASVTQLGSYSAIVLPMCATLLVALASGGTWKDGLLLTLYVYGVALAGIVLLLVITVLAVAVGLWIG